jgi:hypothetical protein
MAPGTWGYEYGKQFVAAVERTDRLGLLEEPVTYSKKTYLSKERFEEFIEFAKREHSGAFMFGLARQAPFVHAALLPAVKEFFSCRAYLTVGSQRTSKKIYYPMSDDSVNRWLRDGIDPSKTPVHVWITLDSLEAIDATIFSTMAEVTGDRENDTAVSSYDPDDPLPDGSPCPIHQPFVLGMKFLEEISHPVALLNSLMLSASPGANVVILKEDGTSQVMQRTGKL